MQTHGCHHVSNSQDSVVLPACCAGFFQFPDTIKVDSKIELYVCLTAGSKHARWRAMLGASLADVGPGVGQFISVLLRGEACCL